MLSVIVQQAKIDADSWLTWAPPVASAAIAALALLLGLANRRTSNRALKLAEQQEARRIARLDLSLKEAISVRRKGCEHRLIGIHVLAVNPTDRQGAIFKAELNITYTTPGGVRMILTVSHDQITSGFPAGVVPLDIPAPLPANDAVSGWLTFELSNELLAPMSIDRYELALFDSRGLVEAVYPWVFRELDDDEEAASA